MSGVNAHSAYEMDPRNQPNEELLRTVECESRVITHVENIVKKDIAEGFNKETGFPRLEKFLLWCKDSLEKGIELRPEDLITADSKTPNPLGFKESSVLHEPTGIYGHAYAQNKESKKLSGIVSAQDNLRHNLGKLLIDIRDFNQKTGVPLNSKSIVEMFNEVISVDIKNHLKQIELDELNRILWEEDHSEKVTDPVGH